jgi:hypothetical protein
LGHYKVCGSQIPTKPGAIVYEHQQMAHDPELPLYRFDEADAELSLLPMAARRALDCAGVHLSLKGWQRLSLDARRALIALGGAEVVDSQAVAQRLAASSADSRPTPPLVEAAADSGPSAELRAAGHSFSRQQWLELSALDRYVLEQLARRGKLERLAVAFAEICGR